MQMQTTLSDCIADMSTAVYEYDQLQRNYPTEDDDTVDQDDIEEQEDESKKRRTR